MPLFKIFISVCIFATISCAHHASATSLANTAQNAPLIRHYQLGEVINYNMRGYNVTGSTPRSYTISAQGQLTKKPSGVFEESFRWMDLVINDVPITLSEQSQSYRQLLSLDRAYDIPFPTGEEFQSELGGPVWDLMSFYADLRIAAHSGRLLKEGDRFSFIHSKPNSWVKNDPNLIIAEDCIDFDFVLKEIDDNNMRVVLVASHVPPDKTCVNLPAPWMKESVSDKPNNWVQVKRVPEGFEVEVGREDFVDIITIELGTGRIIEAIMNNPLNTIERLCSDEALLNCGPVTTHPNKERRIQLRG